MPMISVPEWD